MATMIHPASDTAPMGASTKMNIGDPILDAETSLPKSIYANDRAVKEFGKPSLRDYTNQEGCDGKKFSVMPSMRPFVSDGYYPDSLRTAKPPVQDFWVYDGAQPTLGHNGSTPTSLDQLLPASKLRQQTFVDWYRVGSKKGWMFNGPPQEEYDAPSGENVPTFTSDGWMDQIKYNRWEPMAVDPALQRVAHQDLPAIEVENNARGIGVTGQGSGNGGMAGGYKEVNPERLKQLAIPMKKFNHTGDTVHGTGRLDQGARQGAGGFRSGYNSQYGDFPALLIRRGDTGIRYFTT